MLAGLKVSSLACKCVFYRPELNAKGESHELHFDSLTENAKIKYTNEWSSKSR